ncbi:AraC family transcriptional regulator [Chromatiaceae bacterium AAb-1]|nr:AraC family transcriptional regulator [Chromatiaceae bacterium AAb-1]
MTDFTERASELVRLMQKHYAADGIHQTLIPRLSVIRSSSPTEPVHAVHQPAVCIVVQGAKKVMLGEQIFNYDVARYLVISVDAPISGQITQASPDEPYLCLRLDLDLKILGELLLDMPAPPKQHNSTVYRGVGISQASPRLLDAAIRLFSLLDKPDGIAILAPLAEKEIMYWLVKGEQGAALQQLSNADSRLSQISKAIQHIKTTFKQPFNIDELLTLCCMSSASFFQHFKAVTNMTPLQYQKQLRLQEARRLMVLSERDITSAGYEVGYESQSQFNREYHRLFGRSPTEDISEIRELT